jgi:hypothetical protein
MGNEKVDLFKLHEKEYVAAKNPVLVEIPPARYLSIEGMGEPGGEQFTQRLNALYKVAYSIKMAKKNAGSDYVVCKLEALWWGISGPGDFSAEPASDWNWRLLIRVPDFVAETDLQDAVTAAVRKRASPEVHKVKLRELEEGLCVQVLHVGAYSREKESIEKMNELVKEKGLSFHGLHHEIYLSDPRRVSPEQLKTILRMPVCRP